MIILTDNTVIPESEQEARLIAKIEAMFNYMNYYNPEGPNHRTDDELKSDINDGKSAESLLGYRAKKAGHDVNVGVRILQKYHDNGTDLVIDGEHIQVKHVKCKYFTIKNKDTADNLKAYDGKIVVYSAELDQFFHMPKHVLETRMYRSNYNDGFYVPVKYMTPLAF